MSDSRSPERRGRTSDPLLVAIPPRVLVYPDGNEPIIAIRFARQLAMVLRDERDSHIKVA